MSSTDFKGILTPRKEYEIMFVNVKFHLNNLVVFIRLDRTDKKWRQTHNSEVFIETPTRTPRNVLGIDYKRFHFEFVHCIELKWIGSNVLLLQAWFRALQALLKEWDGKGSFWGSIKEISMFKTHSQWGLWRVTRNRCLSPLPVRQSGRAPG